MRQFTEFNWRRSLLFFSVAAIILIADQITKALIRANLDMGDFVPDDGGFQLTFSTNSGSIFGLPLNSTFLLIMGIVVVAVIFWIHFHYLAFSGKLMKTALGLVTGGALGNLLDRARFGEVTDFVYIDLGFWPLDPWATFNIADASLTTGIFILVWCFLNIAKTANQTDDSAKGMEPENGRHT